MAGGVSRTFGVLFLLIGLILIAGGLGAAYYGQTQEGDRNEDPGSLLPTPDQEEQKEQNDALVIGGLIGAGAGAAFVVVSFVLFVIGKGRAEAALRREIAQSRTVVYAAPGQGVEEAAVAPAAPAAKGQVVSNKAIGAIAVVGILVVAGAAFAFLGSDGGKDTFKGGEDGRADLAVLDSEDWEGSLDAAVKDPVTGGATAIASRDFTPPEGTSRVTIELRWQPGDAGTDTLYVSLSYVAGDQESPLAETSGRSPLSLSGDVPAGATVRIAVAQVEDGIVATQPFTVALTYLG